MPGLSPGTSEIMAVLHNQSSAVFVCVGVSAPPIVFLPIVKYTKIPGQKMLEGASGRSGTTTGFWLRLRRQ